MKHLSLACAVLLAAAGAGRAAAQMARGSGTANASVIDASAIGILAAPSIVPGFKPAVDVAAFLLDPASGLVVLPRGWSALAGGPTSSPDVAPLQVTAQRNADGSVSFVVAGGGNLGYTLTKSPSGAVNVEYN